MLLLNIASQAPYSLANPDQIPTPRLLIFRDRVERNLQKMRNYLEAIAPGSGFRHLCPHIKTNKSTMLTSWMVHSGVGYFKATMREVDLAISAGAKDVFTAYPLLAHEARALAQKIKKHQESAFHVQIGCEAHAKILAQIGAEEKIKWSYFLDIDVGMHRTGMRPEQVLQLFDEISQNSNFSFAGLHGYDGHNHFAQASERRQESQKSMACLIGLARKFRARKIRVPRIMAAGSPAYRFDLEILSAEVPAETLVQVSPGTWILWDSDYEALAPGEYEIAAVILAQVMDVNAPHRFTLNLGHKRWAAERGPLQLFSRPNLKVVSFSEEHTVLEHPAEESYEVGDYVLIVPRHVCPTVNLYEDFTLIGAKGEIEIASSPVDGRNR
jgi:D-serine deaminase-like pyridoxal phosphate-dependent protein